MAEIGLPLAGHEDLKLPFDLDGVLGGGQPELIGNAYAVCVRHNTAEAEHVAADEVRDLPADAAEPEQILHRLGDLAAEFVDQRPAAAADVLRLGIVQPDRANQFLQLALPAFGDAARVGKAREQRPGNEVDARVGALRGEDGHNQQAERVVVVLERAGNVGIQRLQPLVDELCFFLLIHRTKNSLPPKAG